MLKVEKIKNKIFKIGSLIGIDENSLLYPSFSAPDSVFDYIAYIYTA